MSKTVRTALNDTPKPAFELCTVVAVYPVTYSCDVRTDSGRNVNGVPFPALHRDSTGLSGEVNVPKLGERFALHYSLAEPQLVASAPPLQSPTPVVEHRINYNQPVPDSIEEGSRNYRGSLPRDVEPGDWARVASKGNLLAVLESGTTVLKASEICQVIAHRTKDLLQLVGRNMDVVTDFGEIRFKNDGGRVSMSLKGGSQQMTETGAGKDHFTIHAALGAEGDIADFRITDQLGRTLAQVHYRPDGSVSEVAHNKAEVLTGSHYSELVGDRTKKIGGDEACTVGGSSSEEIGGKKSVVADGIQLVSGTSAQLASRDEINVNAGGPLHLTTGGSLTAKPGDAACTTTVVNGSYVVDIGNPVAGDLGKSKSGYSLKTQLGDILLDTTGGKIKLKTLKPDSIQLGPNSGFHAVVFEMLETFLETMGTLLDAHVHTANGAGVPAVQMYSTTKMLLKAAKSKFVTLGG